MQKSSRSGNRWAPTFVVLLSAFVGFVTAASATNVSGTISASTTWTLASSPYIVTASVTVQGSSNPVLTIEPGVEVRFNSNTILLAGNTSNGTIQANGTSAAPIVFTANTGSPTAGYWSSIRLFSRADGSSLSYVQISYAAYGVWIQSDSTVHHASIQNCSGSGLRISAGSPTIYQNNFVGNTKGIDNSSTQAWYTARYCWFNSSSGPSGSGPGTGDSVDVRINFEPWLLSTASDPNYFNSFSLRNRTFNSNIGINADIGFGTTQSQNWTVTITNGSGTTLRTYTGSGSSGSVWWDGKDTGGTLQSNGTYNYQIDSVNAASAKGQVVLDTTKQLTISGLTISNAMFSPNGDTIEETVELSGTISFDGPTWTVNVKDSSNTTVRTYTGSGSDVSVTWDGKNGSGTTQPDGAYTVELLVTDDGASTLGTKTTAIDKTFPVSVITSPVVNQTLSDVYQNGTTDVPVVGTASDANISNWTLYYGAGSNPSSWTTIDSGSSSITSSTMATWATAAVTNGVKTIRLKVTDGGGNITNYYVLTALGNFIVSQENILQFNGASGSTVTYTSTVPFTLTETLYIKNEAGQTVRTLVNAERAAGTYNDAWNGRNDAGDLVPDGAYFYFAGVTCGTYQMTWDVSNQFVGSTVSYQTPTLPTFDPFNNSPRVLSYNFSSAGRITVYWTTGTQYDCNAPSYCQVLDKYEESGAHTVTWAGIDDAGVFRQDIGSSFRVTTRKASFSKNAVVLYGTKPVITNFAVNPASFNPALGQQTVNFTLTTYQSQNVTVTITYTNHDSNTVLRTVTASNVSPGSVAIGWDGLADSGIRVTSGNYTVTGTVTDSIGNQVTTQILTQVIH